MIDFKGKTAIVTGAGRGLGRAYALMLAERGCHVIVNDPGLSALGGETDERPAETVVEEIRKAGGSAVASLHDVATEADAIIARATESSGRIDIVINNAGSMGGGVFSDVSDETWIRMVDSHLMGTVRVSRAAWPHLVKSRGVICNTASSAMFGGNYVVAYSAVKCAIHGFSRSLAHEGRQVGVRVNIVLPTAITRLTARLPDPAMLKVLEEHFSVETVAGFVTWLCHDDCPLNGETFAVGADRAARVEFVQAQGVTAGSTPEDWIGKGEQLLSLDDVAIIKNQDADRDLKFAPFLENAEAMTYRNLPLAASKEA